MKRHAVVSNARLRACHWTTAFIIAPSTLLAGATGAYAKTLRVDDDGVQDTKAKYRSIQAAVDAAKPGDVIQVAPGLYPGSPEKYNVSLSIGKPKLKIKGAQYGNHDTARMTHTPDPTKESIIVMGSNSLTSLILQASNVTLDGFFFLNGSVFVSTVIHDKPPISGVRFENNVVSMKKFTTPEESYSGIVLQNLTSSRISNNIIFAASGSTVSNFGIATDAFMSNVSITGNKFYNLVNHMLINGRFLVYKPETYPRLDTTVSIPFNIKIP